MDINMAETYSAMVKDSLHRLNAKNMDSLAVYYTAVFNHYGITEEQFTRSMAWYQAHPDDLDSVLNQILPRLSNMQQQLTAKLPPKDSVPPARRPAP